MPNLVENGILRHIDTDRERLLDSMRELLKHYRIAAQLGALAAVAG